MNEIVEIKKPNMVQKVDVSSDAAAMLNMISKAAVNPKVDIAKLEKLMDLQERYLDREAKKAYAEDFVRMKPELPVVIKLHRNTQTNSNYAKLEDINKTIDPILSKHGFGTQMKVLSQTPEGATVSATLLHKAGHSESTEVFMPIDNMGIKGTVNKTGPHAMKSTISYAKQTALCALLNISTGDDTDGNREEEDNFITLDQAVEIDKLLNETAIDKEKFLKEYLGDTPSVPEILKKDYAKARNALLARKKTLEKEKTGEVK